jgi:tRNA pseudouridine55 synthase
VKGLLVIDKPMGMTSHDVVARARRATGIRKIGHAGTLDPMATGVLVLAVGQATRLIRYLQDHAKEYRAEIQFGIGTDSLDADGTEVERVEVEFSRTQLEEKLELFRGEIEQVPPMVSALKVGGKRLYQLARAGDEVEREPRPVTIHELDLIDFTAGEFPRATIRAVCSKGTYIRTLADDIAQSLGSRGHLTALRRTRVGAIEVDGALALDELEQWESHLLDPRHAVVDLTQWSASPSEEEAVRSGRRLPLPESTGPWAILDQEHNLLAVYRQEGSLAVAEVVLV